jgi:hypothetical protein
VTYVETDQSDAELPRRRRWSRAERIALVGVIATVVGVGIALATWLRPGPLDDDAGAPRSGNGSVPATAPRSTALPPATVSGDGSGTGRYLDSLEPLTGRANLAPLPRVLAAQSGYDRPVVVRCPTNASDDKVRDVVYELNRRYLDLTATVRPHHPDAEAADGEAWVTATTQVAQRDGTFLSGSAGTRVIATPNRSAELRATVEGVDRLVLKVQCEFPDGLVVLSTATLTRL